MAEHSNKQKAREPSFLKRGLHSVWLSICRTIELVLVLGFTFLVSPVYSLVEATYWESVGESRQAQELVREVIANRRKAEEWPDTYREVILDGAERGNNRDFTYRDHHAWRYLPDSTPIPPYAHAWRHDNLGRLAWIHWDSLVFWVAESLGWNRDPTNGAVFYKVHNHPSSYFDRMVRRGKFCQTVHLGAHVFYALCDSSRRVELKGSSGAVMRAWKYANATGYRFASTERELGWMRATRQVVRADSIPHVTLVDVSKPYLRVDVKTYLSRLAALYHGQCNTDLVVTSMLRFDGAQRLGNASARSVHPAGMAIDLRTTGTPCLGWLESTLLAGERAGFVDVTREYHPPHFHVVVYPEEYRRWLKARGH